MIDWQQYLAVDWQAMTATDWFGLLLTIGIFFALIAIFYWVFHPKNKRRIEGYRHIPFEEDNDE